MKKIVALLVGLFVTLGAYAQSVDYNRIILPDNAKDVSVEERLVQLAWKNNPNSAIAINNTEIGEFDLKKSQWSWLNHINIQGNLNEFTINGRDSNDPQNRSNFYPRYNFGISFSLGTFATRPLDVKMAREKLQNDGEAVKRLKLQIRADVLRRYTLYKTTKELYDLQVESLNDLEAKFLLTKSKFERGETTLNDYTSVKERYDGQRARNISAQNTYLQAKYDLEELLGLKIEEVL